MHIPHLILTLTGGLVAALFLGLITHRIGLSPIVGYLLAGIAVSPHTPGFVADTHLTEQMAEIGIILLMFGVGLQFHFKELLAVKRIAVPGAIGQSAAATALAAVLMHYAFGWTWTQGAVFGLALSVASTVVLTRVLVDNNELHTPTGHIALGWLVVEDLFTVFVLVLLPALFGPGAEAGNGTFVALGLATLKIGALVACTFFVGGWAIPRLLGYIAGTASRELFTLGVLATALGVALGAAALFGVSMALGAFLAGMVVGRSEFSLRAATEALPMRDAFAVLFFVSVGMQFNWQALVDSPWQIATVLAVVVIGKPLAALAITLIFRYPLRTGLAVAVALAQIGEFSFIVATMGQKFEVLPPEAFNILVAVAIISITLTPLLYRGIDPLTRWLTRHPKLGRFFLAQPAEGDKHATTAEEMRRRAVIVGHGPVGRTMVRLLAENGIESVVIEMNLETVQRLRADNIPAVYGDASLPDTLKTAGVENAAILILSASSLRHGKEIIREARALNENIRVLARTAYLREAEGLRRAGADGVFAGEGEVALAMTGFILERFSATPEQIDREQDRIRRELFEERPARTA